MRLLSSAPYFSRWDRMLELHSSTASAQNSPTSDKVCALSDTIAFITDYAQWRAFYRKQYRDTPSNPREYRWIQLLQIGNKHQAYVNYGELRADLECLHQSSKSKGEFQSEWSAARKESLPDTKLLFDRSKGTLDAYDKWSSLILITTAKPSLPSVAAGERIARS